MNTELPYDPDCPQCEGTGMANGVLVHDATGLVVGRAPKQAPCDCWIASGDERPDPRKRREDAVQAARRVVDEATTRAHSPRARLEGIARNIPELQGVIYGVVPGRDAYWWLQLADGELRLDDEKSDEQVAADIREWLQSRAKK